MGQAYSNPKMSRYCGVRTLCPIGQHHSTAVALARSADGLDRGVTEYKGRAYDAAMAAWRRHSAECKRVSPRCKALRAEGFDRSTDEGKLVHVACSSCEALVLNGTACHEHGCPNTTHHETEEETDYD